MSDSPIADKKENYRQAKVGIQEKEGEGLNMGVCPLFELEVPGEEITVCPDRKAVCEEMTKFMRLRILGRNVQKRGGEILEKVFLKPNAPKDNSLYLLLLPFTHYPLPLLFSFTLYSYLYPLSLIL